MDPNDNPESKTLAEAGVLRLSPHVSSGVVDKLWTLNEANSEATSSFSREDFETHLSMASCLLADHSLHSFLILFHMKLNYNSVNYKWLQSKGCDGAYIDRIIIGENLQNQGLGRRLYNQARHWAISEGLSSLLCEVNLNPPNPKSLKFHEAMGFELIADVIHPVKTDMGNKAVRFLKWDF
jgi:uncharacterized protein